MTTTAYHPTPTIRTDEQRLEALRQANATRSRRAQMKRHFRDRTGRPIALLAEPPAWLASMRVTAYLQSIPKIGATKARELMRIARIADSKTVGGISDRQRVELAKLLQERRYA